MRREKERKEVKRMFNWLKRLEDIFLLIVTLSLVSNVFHHQEHIQMVVRQRII